MSEEVKGQFALRRKIMAVMLFGFAIWLIYNAKTAEDKETIFTIVRQLDTAKAAAIVIRPSNEEYKINLLSDTAIIKDKQVLNELIQALKTMSEKHVPKGVHNNWECYLRLDLIPSAYNGLKHKEPIDFDVFDTPDGLFVEMTNVTGEGTYACPTLKAILERIANFHGPV